MEDTSIPQHNTDPVINTDKREMGKPKRKEFESSEMVMKMRVESAQRVVGFEDPNHKDY